ncbi:HNH endonuclease [Streptomyces cellulosae]
MCPRHKRLHQIGTQCPLCQAAPKRKYPSKNTRRPGGYDYQWQKVRAKAIQLQPYCTFCGTDQDLTGDHIIPLKAGGTNTLDNVRVLCRSCNTRRENDLRKGRLY